jgi:hypothetical protein
VSAQPLKVWPWRLKLFVLSAWESPPVKLWLAIVLTAEELFLLKTTVIVLIVSV